MKETFSQKQYTSSWVKAGVKAGESEGCCFFILLKMEIIKGFFEEEQNAMLLSCQRRFTLVGKALGDVVNIHRWNGKDCLCSNGKV